MVPKLRWHFESSNYGSECGPEVAWSRYRKENKFDGNAMSNFEALKGELFICRQLQGETSMAIWENRNVLHTPNHWRYNLGALEDVALLNCLVEAGLTGFQVKAAKSVLMSCLPAQPCYPAHLIIFQRNLSLFSGCWSSSFCLGSCHMSRLVRATLFNTFLSGRELKFREAVIEISFHKDHPPLSPK